MTLIIQPADPNRDYDRVAEIMQTFERQPVTADTLREWDVRNKPGTIRRRCIGVNEDGQIVGYCGVVHNSWMTAGDFGLTLIVDPPFRKQGYGRQFYDDALAFAEQQGAVSLGVEVLDSDTVSLRFAEQRGYVLTRHVFESTIDLCMFDDRRFDGLIESVEATGIRFFSLEEAGNTHEALRKLWEVNYQAVMDDPGSDKTFPNFEEFQEILYNGHWFRPDGQMLAADRDQYVGLSAVGYFEQTQSAYNMITGVMPNYRGRKIALSLKLLTIRAAKRWSVDFIRTDNDSQNVPMLAINRKLGYVPQPGLYRLALKLKR